MGMPIRKQARMNDDSGCEIIDFPRQNIDTYSDSVENCTKAKKKEKGTRKSNEVFHLTIEDSKRMLNFLEEKQRWMEHCILTIALNTGRRAGDILNFTWDMVYKNNGEIRDTLRMQEQKTKKYAMLPLSDPVRQSIIRYAEKTGRDPAENNYKNYMFSNLESGSPIAHSTYWRWLKKGMEALNIEYNVGTHSARKTFGWAMVKNHPGDQQVLAILQTIFNHSSQQVTLNYIGITDEVVANCYQDQGAFFDRYISGDSEFKSTDGEIVHLLYDDILEIITNAYKLGMQNANTVDVMAHANAVNSQFSELMKRKK